MCLFIIQNWAKNALLNLDMNRFSAVVTSTQWDPRQIFLKNLNYKRDFIENRYEFTSVNLDLIGDKSNRITYAACR